MLSKQATITLEELPNGWSEDAGDFINKLLLRKQELRLGYHGIYEIKQHPWMRYFPWEKLLHKQLESPFIPSNKKDNYDKRYCEQNDKLGIETKMRYEQIRNDMYYNKQFINFTYYGIINGKEINNLDDVNKSLTSRYIKAPTPLNIIQYNCISSANSTIQNNSHKRTFLNRSPITYKHITTKALLMRSKEMKNNLLSKSAVIKRRSNSANKSNKQYSYSQQYKIIKNIKRGYYSSSQSGLLSRSYSSCRLDKNDKSNRKRSNHNSNSNSINNNNNNSSSHKKDYITINNKTLKMLSKSPINQRIASNFRLNMQSNTIEQNGTKYKTITASRYSSNNYNNGKLGSKAATPLKKQRASTPISKKSNFNIKNNFVNNNHSNSNTNTVNKGLFSTNNHYSFIQKTIKQNNMISTCDYFYNAICKRNNEANSNNSNSNNSAMNANKQKKVVVTNNPNIKLFKNNKKKMLQCNSVNYLFKNYKNSNNSINSTRTGSSSKGTQKGKLGT